MLGVIFRGNWDFIKDCVLLRYLFQNKYVAMAGKILAGYRHPEQKVYPPQLSAVTDESDCNQIAMLFLMIFGGTFWEERRLKPIADTLLASLLMHHAAVKRRYGATHPVVRILEEHAHEVNVTPNKIIQWGQIIATTWREKNEKEEQKVLQVKASQLGVAEGVVVEQNQKLQDEIKGLREENKDLKKEVTQSRKCCWR